MKPKPYRRCSWCGGLIVFAEGDIGEDGLPIARDYEGGAGNTGIRHWCQGKNNYELTRKRLSGQAK